MKTRIITASVGIPLLVFASLSKSVYPILFVCIAIAIIAILEIFRAELVSVWQPGWIAVGLVVVGIADFDFGIITRTNLLALTLSAVLLMGGKSSPFPQVVRANILCIGWIGCSLMTLVAIHASEAPRSAALFEFLTGSKILLLFLCLWAGDTAAYFVGSAIGKHKIAPTLSPNKSWEGAIANLIAAALVGWLVAPPFSISAITGVSVGVAVGLFGQFGDLAQSAWKRSHGLKDSGALLPGHGGVLDRFDSLLFAAPIAAILYWVIPA